MKEMNNCLTLIFLIVGLFLLYSYLFMGHAAQSLIGAAILLIVCLYRVIKKYRY
ncbi:hypothetical protein IGJ02_000158 [Enterococcus sp. DIV0724b]